MQLLRRPVGGDHDLAAILVQGIEGEEKLRLRARSFARSDELDVINEAEVYMAEPRSEGIHLVLADSVEHVLQEGLATDIQDLLVRMVRLDSMADGLHQMRLPQAYATVDEQGVVGSSWGLGDAARSGVRDTVGRTDDEVIEGVLRVEGARREFRRAGGRSNAYR